MSSIDSNAITLVQTILRQGWTSLDFREEEHAARLAKLLAKNAEIFDEIVSKQTTLLEKEIIDLTNEADQLSKKIGKLTTQSQPGEEILT